VSREARRAGAEAVQRPGAEREAGLEAEPGTWLEPEVGGERDPGAEPGTGEQRAEKVIEAIAAQSEQQCPPHTATMSQTVSSTVIQSETN
jgi:hypothetical protein